ncbi:unnamed protein product [Amoebophrya sp. A25]|nr:unnamed protein product [Amoebophrya sp. A25]|eukprot:GSA25T00014247001.1
MRINRRGVAVAAAASAVAYQNPDPTAYVPTVGLNGLPVFPDTPTPSESSTGPRIALQDTKKGSEAGGINAKSKETATAAGDANRSGPQHAEKQDTAKRNLAAAPPDGRTPGSDTVSSKSRDKESLPRRFFGSLFGYFEELAKTSGKSNRRLTYAGSGKGRNAERRKENESPWDYRAMLADRAATRASPGGGSPQDVIHARALRRAAIEFSNRKMFALYGHAYRYLNPRHGEPGEDIYLSPNEVALLSLERFVEMHNPETGETERRSGEEGSTAARAEHSGGKEKRGLESVESDMASQSSQAVASHPSPSTKRLDESATSSKENEAVARDDETRAAQGHGHIASHTDQQSKSAAAEQARRRRLYENLVKEAKEKEKGHNRPHSASQASVVADRARRYLEQIVATAMIADVQSGGVVDQKELKNRGRGGERQRTASNLVRRALSILETQMKDTSEHKSSAAGAVGVPAEDKKHEKLSKTSSDPGAAPRIREDGAESEAKKRMLQEQLNVDDALQWAVQEKQAQTMQTLGHLHEYHDVDHDAFYSQLQEVEQVLRHLQTNATANNATTTTTTTTAGCNARINCCADVKRSVKILAAEYTDLGLTAVAQQTWTDLSETQCATVDCDCVALAAWVETQCVFYVGQIVSSPSEVQNYCGSAGGTRNLFEKAYCPAACAPVDCNSQEGRQCMQQCGDYLNCECSNRLGSQNPPRCVGVLEVDGSACFEPPAVCAMHTISTSACAPYHFCPKNQCLIRNRVCIPDDMCQGDGICIPSTGQCIYPNLPRGTECEDNIFYTYNKTCNGMGKCIGLVNMCQQHNIQCRSGVPDCTFLPGQCQPETGRCVYDFRPDDTECDDGRPYTVGDQCQKGLCVGTIVDLCASINCAPVPCVDDGGCHDMCYGTCDQASGACKYERKPNGVPCDDRQGNLLARNPRCIDGVCVGDPFHGSPNYRTVGEGQCVDELGFRMNAQQGDVGEESECRQLCTEDNQCKGYSFAFPICTLFGTVRSTTDFAGWNMLEGDQTPALEIQRVLAPKPGEPEFVCRKKDYVGDPESSGFTILNILIGWGGFSAIFGILLAFYFRETICEALIDGKNSMLDKKDQLVEKYKAGRKVDPYFDEGEEPPALGDASGVSPESAIQDAAAAGEIQDKESPNGEEGEESGSDEGSASASIEENTEARPPNETAEATPGAGVES